ncbi:MAG: ubiquinone biosynthesis accessory factor UbiJ [Burkholderiales bacterium]
MLEVFAVPALNRLLRSSPWALERLQPHAGKTALLACPPVELKLTVTESGELTPAVAETQPDVTIETTPGLLLRVVSGDENAWGEAQVHGDVQLAGAIDYLRRNLNWDYEEDLSRIFGDIVAHRMVSAAHGLQRWGRSAAVNVARAVGEYATHENPQIASAQALEEFNAEVDRVRDDVERLEKRIELLQQSLAARGRTQP